MKILITGGAGFIGSHLVEACLRRGDEVIVLDDFSTGRMANLPGPADGRSPRVECGSVLESARVRTLVHQVDVVAHLAGPSGTRQAGTQSSSMRNAVLGTEYVIRACAAEKKRLLLASGGSVYGKTFSGALSERSDSMLGASSKRAFADAAAKMIAEHSAFAARDEEGLEVIIARLFNVLGPRMTMRSGRALVRFIAQARAGLPLTLYGDGRQTRAFVHVDEAVSAMLALLDDPRAVGEVVNVGGTEVSSVLKLARRVKQLSRTHAPLVRAFPAEFEEPPSRVPNLEKLESLIGWKPCASLDRMIIDALREATQTPFEIRGGATAPPPAGASLKLVC